MAKKAKIYPKGRFILRPLKQHSGMTNAVYMYYFWQRKQLRKAMDLYVDLKDWNENAEHGTGGLRASYGSDYQEKNVFLQSLLEKPRVFDPRGRVALTPENVFILTPKKPWPVGSFLFRLTCLL